jgi:hypothetical protein
MERHMAWSADPQRGAWLIPSRGRPQKLARLMAALKDSECTTPGLVIIQHHETAAYGEVPLHLGWQLVAVDPESQGDKIRAIWPRLHYLDWIGLGGDDQIPITAGWDLRLIKALNGSNLVSCNDDWTIHGDERHPAGRIAGFVCFSGPLLRAIGHQVFLPGMHHTCFDDAYEHLDRLEPCRAILHDVLIKHRHYANSTDVPRDETYTKAYDYYGPSDELTWRKWRDGGDAARAASRIRGLKELLPP